MVHWHKDSNEVMFLKDLKRHTKDVKIDTIIYILQPFVGSMALVGNF